MSGSLLEPEPLPPPNPWPLRIVMALVVLAVAAGALYYQFRFYREEKVVRLFMDALVAGDYQLAYRIWNPTPAYSFQAFLEDWGETTPFGRVRSYEILEVRPNRGVVLQVPSGGGQAPRNIRVGGDSTGVVARVRINGIEEPVRLWVEANPPRLSFPPY
ncbi:MAG: hypothetical protein ACRD4D_05840 [Candidatus Acidiferrales bacterium]